MVFLHNDPVLSKAAGLGSPRLSVCYGISPWDAPNAPRPLRRLLYTSRAAAPEQCTAALLRDIEAQSEHHNRRDGVTGFLVYSAPFFFQVIEGPPRAIARLCDRIMVDPRHVDRVIILDVLCSERLYEDWAMKVSDIQSLALHPTIATVLSRFGASFTAMWPYLPGNAALLLVQGKNPIEEAPEQMQVVTAFIHLVEFGAIVQQPALIKFLPDVLGLFVDACARYVTESGGQIAKFIDGTCMAYWPGSVAADAVAAVSKIAARFRASRETEPSWSPLSLLHTAAGLHFGGALLCHAGQRKSDFTLLGDSINTAARIAALALQRRRPLLLSGAVAALLGDHSGLCSMGAHILRGREGGNFTFINRCMLFYLSLLSTGMPSHISGDRRFVPLPTTSRATWDPPGGVECFHFNEPEIPTATLRSAIRAFSPSSSFSAARPRQPALQYDDLTAGAAPPLFHELQVPPASPPQCATPRAASLLTRATSWVKQPHNSSEELITLTYISRTAPSFFADDANVTFEGARAHNQQVGITSCLLLFRGAVVQTLEGPPSAVLPLWRRLRADRWLTDTVAVHMTALPQRQHAEPLQVMRLTSDMLATFPALPDVLTQLARSFLCLETYVPSVVVRHIAAGQDPRSLQPVKVSVTMLAADICGFTSLSEGCALQGVWHLCNTFIETCTAAILAHGGEVLKLIGDCVTAFFPIASTEAAVAAAEAIVCACEQVRLEHSLAETVQHPALMALWAGVGLDFGPVVIAHCGSAGTACMMVTGEVSSRVLAVEAATRDVGCAIVASGAFVGRLPDRDTLFEALSRDTAGVPLHRRRGHQWTLDVADVRARIRHLRPFLRADADPAAPRPLPPPIGEASAFSVLDMTATHQPPPLPVNKDRMDGHLSPTDSSHWLISPTSSPPPTPHTPSRPGSRFRLLRAVMLCCAPCLTLRERPPPQRLFSKLWANATPKHGPRHAFSATNVPVSPVADSSSVT